MRLRLLPFLVVLAALVCCVALPNAGPLFAPFRASPATPEPLDLSYFQVTALTLANRARARLPVPPSPLVSHRVANATLQEFVRTGIGAPDTFQRLFRTLQAERPQLHEIGSNLLSASSQKELLMALSSWNELTNPAYTHLATTIFRRSGSPEIICLAAVLHELPPLHLPVSRQSAVTAFETCPVCRKGHAVTLSPQSQSTVCIRCPNCDSPYNLLAADDDGNWRRANQFLEGFNPFPASPGLDPEQVVLQVWKQLDEHCRYQLDPERIGGLDSWNLPHQTFELSWGDCEDTAMLLADALIANGIEARVALGRMKGKGHAWCVVRLGERQHILESTAAGVKNLRRLPRMDDLALDYQPECLFDRDTVCFNRYQEWTSNYWTGSTWVVVRYPQEASSTIASANP